MWTWILRLILWPIALFAAIIAAAFFLIQQEPVQQFVARKSLAYLNRTIAGSLSAERVRFALDGSVLLNMVSLQDDAGREILSLDKLRARLALWDLLKRRIHILSADFEGLRGDIQVDSTGSNIANAFASDSPSSPDTTAAPLWLRLNRISLSVDSLTVRADSSFVHTFRDWTIETDAFLDNTLITYRATVHADSSLSLESKGVVRLESDSLFAGDLSLVTNSSYVISDWSKEFPDLGELKLTASGDVLARDLALKFDLMAQRVGSANGDLEVLNYSDLPRVSLGATFLNLDLAHWLGDSVDHRFSGRAALTKSKSPDWTHDWLGRIELDSSYYGNIDLAADLEVELYEQDAFVAGAVRTNAGNFEVRVSANGLQNDSLSVSGHAALDHARVQAFVPEIPDSLSTLSGSTEFSFATHADSLLWLDAQVQLGALSLGRYALDSLSLHASFEGSQFKLDSTRLRLGSASALLFANGDMSDSVAAQLSLALPEVAEFRELISLFAPELDSLSGDLTAELRATLLFAEDSLSGLSALGSLTSTQLIYSDYRLTNTALDLAAFDLASESLSAQLRADSLSALDESLTNLTLDLNGSWLAPEFLCSFSARHDTVALKSSGRFDYSAQPMLLELDSLSLTLFDTEWTNDYPIEFSMDSSHYEVAALVLRSEFGVLRATGFLESPGMQDVALEFSGLRTAKLSPILETELPDGTLNLRLQISGPDSAVTGNIELLIDSMVYQDALLADQLKLTGTLAPDHAEAALAYVWQGDTALTAEAALPAAFSLQNGLKISKDDSIRGVLKVDSLPLVRFQPWMTPGARFEGVLSADLALSGSTDEPNWSGTVRLADGFYGDNRYGIAYKWIVLDAELVQDSVNIHTFRATSKGTLTGSGTAKLGVPWPEALDLNLKFDKFEAVSSRLQKARLDGSMNIAGPFDSLFASGKLTVQEGFYRITQSATKDIESVDLDSVLAVLRGDSLDTGFNPDEFYMSMAHDISVSIPGNFWIRGSGLNTELFGELNLEKTHGVEPTANGEISIRKGSVKFYGQELRIAENSSLRFDGPPESPDLNITAVYSGIDKSRGPYQVTVVLTGTPDNSKAEFSGQFDNGNAMSQDEAIQKLLPFVGNSGGTAEQAVAEAASGQVSDIVGKASGLDVFEFRPGEGGLNDLSSAQLEIGTYVTDRLFIRVFQPIEDPRSGQKVSIDYRLLDWMKFTAEQTTADQGRPSSSFTVYLQFEWR
ncbi:MAG: translocation/assembly module TamB [Calditrichaeota bacterium]|nr:translocation/assembly module TamB [Calditrichota bacterium]